jgi:hypothetical protein
VSVPEAGGQAQLPSDESLEVLSASDASDGVLLDATADAYPELPGGGAEKSVVPALVDPAPDGLQQRDDSQWAAQAGPAEPYTPDVVPFAERSCAVRAFGDEQGASAARLQPDAVAELEAQLAAHSGPPGEPQH